LDFFDATTKIEDDNAKPPKRQKKEERKTIS